MSSVKNNPFASKTEETFLEEEEDLNPMLPDEALLSWSYFIKLHQQRPSGGMGFSCLSYTDIKAFCDLTQTYIEPWELETILAFDRCFMEVSAEAQEREHKKTKSK